MRLTASLLLFGTIGMSVASAGWIGIDQATYNTVYGSGAPAPAKIFTAQARRGNVATDQAYSLAPGSGESLPASNGIGAWEDAFGNPLSHAFTIEYNALTGMASFALANDASPFAISGLTGNARSLGVQFVTAKGSGIFLSDLELNGIGLADVSLDWTSGGVDPAVVLGAGYCVSGDTGCFGALTAPNKPATPRAAAWYSLGLTSSFKLTGNVKIDMSPNYLNANATPAVYMQASTQSPVPEPGTMGLMAAAGAGLIAFARKLRRN